MSKKNIITKACDNGFELEINTQANRAIYFLSKGPKVLGFTSRIMVEQIINGTKDFDKEYKTSKMVKR